MKKVIGILLALTFVAVLAAGSYARTLGEEKQAVRDYLKVIDAKIIKYRAQGNTVKMKQLQAEKQGTLRRWEKLKAQLESEETPWVPPTPAPVAPAPSVKPVSATAGMGLTMGGKVGLTAGLFAVTGDLDYALDSILPGAKARLSVDYVTGNNPKVAAKVDNPMKAVDIKIGGTYALDMLKNAALPVDWYLGAAYIIPVKVNNARTGKWGAEAYLGGKYMVPDFGTIYGELGYAGLKYANNVAALRGVNVAVGYAYSF
ncbi:MAG: hypothetical protein WC527_00915 [Candidatus Margulisiibacteriota bacterium]